MHDRYFCEIFLQIYLFLLLQKKRKLEQLIKDKLKSPTGFASLKQESITNDRRKQLSQASSISCLLNSVDSAQIHDEKFIIESHTSGSLVTFDEALPEKPVTTESSCAEDVVVLNCTSKDVCSISDSDESVNGSNPSSPRDSTPTKARHLGIGKVSGGSRRRCLEPSRRSPRLLNFIGDHLERKAIPVGPRFQTDVPEWDDTVDKSILIRSYNSDPDNLKWLGSQVWPVENGNVKPAGRIIGKGRHNSCSCASRGSAYCIKRHVLEERQRLQRDLGPAFSSWKFDEMGEQVSESWSLKEKKSFESLMKKKPLSDGNAFWKRALKCLPRKSKKDVVNFYFNVYIQQRMSLHRISPSTKQIDTDDEDGEEDEAEAKNSDSKSLQKRAKEKKSPITPKKKARYLQSS